MNTIKTKYYIPSFLAIWTFLSTQETSHATDTINNSQILRDNGTTLISSGRTFELGFFSPENSKNRYVGIWYKKVSARTVVWVANRDNPLKDRSGALKVLEPGFLVLLINGTNGIVWSTNTSRNVQNPVAHLLDSGNLVVKDGNDDNPENFLWQSFDYPTDTLLPGMKLGWNFVTGLEVYITSTKSSNDPASGDYTYHCDPTGYPQNVLKNGTSVRYKTGPWNGVHFRGSQILRENTNFTFEMVISQNEVYNHFELQNDSVSSRFTLSDKGDGQRWVWAYQNWTPLYVIPVDYCDAYKRCGPYGNCNINNSTSCGCLSKFEPKDRKGWDRGDWWNGCVRSTPLNCQKGDVFLKYSGVKLPDTQHSWYDMSVDLEECEVLCSKNCSCMAYASLDIRGGGGNGCLLWLDDLVDMREMSPGQDVYIRMAASELGKIPLAMYLDHDPFGYYSYILKKLGQLKRSFMFSFKCIFDSCCISKM